MPRTQDASWLGQERAEILSAFFSALTESRIVNVFGAGVTRMDNTSPFSGSLPRSLYERLLPRRTRVVMSLGVERA